MEKIISENIKSIFSLCRKHRVKSLDVFGSALTDRFNKDSDVDLLVDFRPFEVAEYASNYCSLKYALEDMFHRPVDLIEYRGIRNPLFLAEVERTKRPLYYA